MRFVLLCALLLGSAEAKKRRRRSDMASQAGDPNAGGLVMVEDIQRRVATAGGNAKGKLAISLSWSTHDDLDLHVFTPSGEEIFYGRREFGGGVLDVDQCAAGLNAPDTCPATPVENVVFKSKPAPGNYRIMVRAYRYNHQSDPHQPVSPQDKSRPIPFDLLVRLKGKNKLFTGLCTRGGLEGAVSDVRVYEFTLDGGYTAHPSFEAENMGSLCTASARIAPGAAGGAGYLPPGGSPGAVRSHGDGGDAGFDYGQQNEKRQKKADRKRARKKKKLGPTQRFAESELVAMRVGTLKRTLKEFGGKCKGCTEKSQYVKAMLKRQKKLDKKQAKAAQDEL
jgi:hypothetical protein